VQLVHPSPLLEFASSHCSEPTVIPSPQIGVQTEETPVQEYPASISQLVHPSLLIAFPSSHDSPDSTDPFSHTAESVHALGSTAVLQVYPDSIVQVLLQPSPGSVFPSSHPSEPLLLPLPQISIQDEGSPKHM
jgi:hypothetical protein